MKILITESQYKNLMEINDNIYYHGSNVDFEKFELFPNHSGEQFISGVFLSLSKKYARKYGNIIYTCKLKRNNLFDFRNKNHMMKYMEILTTYFKKYNEFKDVDLSLSDIVKIFDGKWGNLIKEKNLSKYKELFYYYKNNQTYETDEYDEFMMSDAPLIIRAHNYAINNLLNNPNNTTALIDWINHSFVIYQGKDNWVNLEKAGVLNVIKDVMGFDGAYIMEQGNLNVVVYDVDNIVIVDKEYK